MCFSCIWGAIECFAKRKTILKKAGLSDCYVTKPGAQNRYRYHKLHSREPVQEHSARQSYLLDLPRLTRSRFTVRGSGFEGRSHAQGRAQFGVWGFEFCLLNSVF
jgi:hypothetical protein